MPELEIPSLESERVKSLSLPLPLPLSFSFPPRSMTRDVRRATNDAVRYVAVYVAVEIFKMHRSFSVLSVKKFYNYALPSLSRISYVIDARRASEDTQQI